MDEENESTTTQGEAVDPASALFGFAPPPLEILIEIETTLPTGEQAIYTQRITYNGEIMLMSDEQKRESVKLALGSEMGEGKIIAVHVPVESWKRIAIEPNDKASNPHHD